MTWRHLVVTSENIVSSATTAADIPAKEKPKKWKKGDMGGSYGVGFNGRTGRQLGIGVVSGH
jgi:hypothetical protein